MNEELIEKCRLTENEQETDFEYYYNAAIRLKEESEARLEIINRLTARCEQLINEAAEARKQERERIKNSLPSVGKIEVGEYLMKECGFSSILVGCIRDDIAKLINKKLRQALKEQEGEG